MSDVVMPRLSDSMEEGTILRWLKRDGDQVGRGEELVEIETDKATMTYEADQDGVLEIVAGEGDTLPIGEVIARIASGSGNGAAPESERDNAEPAPGDGDGADPDGLRSEPAYGPQDAEPGPGRPVEPVEEPGPAPRAEPVEAEPAEAKAAASGPSAASPAVARAPAPAPERDGERVKASPVARRIARDLGIEIGGLEGSGPGGRIVKADVEAAAGGEGAQRAKACEDHAPRSRTGEALPPPGTAKGEPEVCDLSRTQQLIARRMAESKATVPDFTLQADVDMERAVQARAELKLVAGDGPAPSLNDMVVKACALALRDFPRANGAYRDGRLELYPRVNVGVAVAAQDTLVVPTVFDADRKSLGQIARESRELAEKVRRATITPPELSGATFTVSNLGMFGISRFTAVINPPQAAILAVGSVEPRPVVRDGEIVARHTLALTLACDHRILYGAPAAEFLARVRELLEHPASLAL